MKKYIRIIMRSRWLFLYVETWNIVYMSYAQKKKIFALSSISLIKMSSYNITLGKNGPNLILLNINNVIKKQLGLHFFFLLSQQEYFFRFYLCN